VLSTAGGEERMLAETVQRERLRDIGAEAEAEGGGVPAESAVEFAAS